MNVSLSTWIALANALGTIGAFLYFLGKFTEKLNNKAIDDEKHFRVIEEDLRNNVIELEQRIKDSHRSHESNDAEKFTQFAKYSTEFFERIAKVEIRLAEHDQFNRSTIDHFNNVEKNQDRIYIKLETIEAILRSRRKDDREN
jgi:hypothetical protein